MFKMLIYLLTFIFVFIFRKKMAQPEVSELPSEMIQSTLREMVEKKLKSQKFKINLSSASAAGSNNFIGIVYRATFSKEDENENEESPIHKMIVKVAPQHTVRRGNEFHLIIIYFYFILLFLTIQLIVRFGPFNKLELFISRPTFLREMFMYETVS